MAIKNCCIEDCFSCSSKEEDVGVTYHKFPKDKALRDIWNKISQFIDKDVNLPYYVCSRHFCKSDFQSLEDSKYVLKSDAVPSIFPWTIRDISDINMESNEKETDASNEKNTEPMQVEVDKQQAVQSDKPKLDNVDLEHAEVSLDMSKESEGDGIEAIRKFIEEQEKEIQELQAEVKPHTAKIILKPDTTKDEEIATTILESKDEAKYTEVAISDSNVINDVREGAIKQDDKSNGEKSKEDSSYDTEHHKDDNSDKTKTKDSNKTISGTSNDNRTQVKDKKTKKDLILEDKLVQHDDVSMAVASAVMNIILSESEAKLAKPPDGVKSNKHLLSGEKGTSAMALSVGSKIEAKDFGEHWHPANIAEVDYDEMEVLVRYEDLSKKHDEWISVSSPRLRPQGSPSKVPPEPTSEPVVKEEPREEKPKMPYKVGDRCLARWRDNRRFQATVLADLGDGNYEVVFDDGFVWRCPVARLSKMRDGDSKPPLSVPLQVHTALSPAPAPLATPPGPAAPPYHTHLFDPARDFLGSKSDRRERKRKLNIKEIFNIGQKKKKDESAPAKKIKAEPAVKKPKVAKQKVESAKGIQIKTEVKPVLPDAVASIIGSVTEEVQVKTEVEEVEIKEEEQKELQEQKEPQKADVKVEAEEDKMQVDEVVMIDPSLPVDNEVQEEEEPKDDTNDSLPIKDDEEMLKILEAYNKLEDKFNQPISPEPAITTIKPEPKPQVKDKTKPAKAKKAKKLKQLRDTKVSEEVLKVKIELEAVKSQLAAIKKRAGLNADEWLKDQAGGHPIPMPDSYLLPGMWCCKWHNGEPVGISEMQFESKDAKGLPRRSVQVEDKRLPAGWTKHMVRRSLGSSAGKWDVVIVAPDNKRLHTKTDMRNYLEGINDEEHRAALEPFEHVLLDFGVHRKMARRLGWDTKTVGPDGDVRPAPPISTTSPLVKLTKMNVRKEKAKLANLKKRKTSFGTYSNASSSTSSPANQTVAGAVTPREASFEYPPLEDGYVYVGSLKVQMIENLLRCPADACFKNFRTPTLLQMHIKHYHREMRKMMGATPKVADLASARATPLMPDKIKSENEPKVPKLKISKKRLEDVKTEPVEPKYEMKTETSPMTTPTKTDPDKIPRSLDSPRLRNALASSSQPHKRPRVLLPVRKEDQGDADSSDSTDSEINVSSNVVPLDFESAISTHTVTKPIASEKKKKGEKRKKTFATISKVKPGSEDEEWGANSDYETRSSFPRSGSPDSKFMDTPTMPVSSESTEDQKDPNMYMFTETGERIKLVHMKREEIINCHCTVREEDGLMIQCELCLCWQHALCHNIHKEAEVPEKYTCSICLNPRLGRRSRRFLHDQDRLYEGLLPGARACPSLRRAHELSGNLLGIQDALHALRVKNYVATKKDHPKLYLWASEWETGESFTSALTADYADLSAMISSLNKENISHDDGDRLSRGAGGSQLGSLSGLLSSPGGASLDLPISTSDLERLAKSVQEAEALRTNVIVPQPEAPIENSVCRERLLRHIRRCQALVDARLDSIEAQVAELESQDPSFEDDETADYFPRTKQTIQMLLRDLDTMEELAVIT